MTLTDQQVIIVARAMNDAAWAILTKACELRDTLAAPAGAVAWPLNQLSAADLDAYYAEWREVVEAENAALAGHLRDKPTDRTAFERAMEEVKPSETIAW